MALTYEPIASTTLGSSAPSISFNSISTAYTDLRLIVSGLNATSAGGWRIRVNGDSGSNYSYNGISGNGTTASSFFNSSQAQLPISGFLVNTSTTIPMLATVDIFSYNSTSVTKTFLIANSNDQNGSGEVVRVTGLWNSTSAINSILLFRSGTDNLGVGLTATLYGIKAA